MWLQHVVHIRKITSSTSKRQKSNHQDNNTCATQEGVVAKRIRAANSSSGASVQQSVGSNLGLDTCVPEQDT